GAPRREARGAPGEEHREDGDEQGSEDDEERRAQEESRRVREGPPPRIPVGGALDRDGQGVPPQSGEKDDPVERDERCEDRRGGARAAGAGRYGGRIRGSGGRHGTHPPGCGRGPTTVVRRSPAPACGRGPARRWGRSWGVTWTTRSRPV